MNIKPKVSLISVVFLILYQTIRFNRYGKLKKCVTEVDSKVKNEVMHNGTKPVHTKPG